MRGWLPHESVPELETLRLDDPNRVSLKGRRRVRARVAGPQSLRDWPSERRALVVEWLERSKSVSPRWVKWMEWAKSSEQLAEDTLQGLLLRGWIEVEEVKNQQTRGVWHSVQIHWRDLKAIRAELGLVDLDMQRMQRDAAKVFHANDERLIPLEAALANLAPQLSLDAVLARRQLAESLCVWLQAQGSGTRRNFEHEARGKTKSITPSEWRWLEHTVDLEACNIFKHQPLILLGGMGQLLRDGQPMCSFDLLAGYLALTPANFEAMSGVSGIHTLRVIENLTSFETYLAKRVAGELLIWLPGYAAAWWLDAFAALVRHVPGQVLIACDCDPWGIELAMRTEKVVEQQNKTWQPWLMDAATLYACTVRDVLNGKDRDKLDQLLAGDLPQTLRELAHAQYDLSAKAEQEQYL